MKKMNGDGRSKNINKYPDFKFYTTEEMKGKSIWLYIYNKKEKSFLGKTRRRWGICLLFYLVFYSSLVLLWTITFVVAMYIYGKHEGPWYILEDSRIGGNPKLVHYPSNYGITIERDNEELVQILNELLSRYQNLSLDDYNDCQVSPSEPESCYFDVNELGNCTQDDSYGYDQNTPCVMLRLNKVYSWKPKIYNEPGNLPEAMPSRLKSYINLQDPEKRNMIWVSCAEMDETKSYLKEINYWPGQGIPAYFYPFMGKKGHLSAIIAVQFVSKKNGVSVRIKCQAWARDLNSMTTFTIKFKE